MKTLSVFEAAGRLGIKRNTLYGMIKRGVIRHSKIEGSIRIALEDIEAYEMDFVALKRRVPIDDEAIHQIIRKRLFKPAYVDPSR